MADKPDEIDFGREWRCFVAIDSDNQKIHIPLFKKGDRIAEWLIGIRRILFRHKWSQPMKDILLNSMDTPSREYALSQGLDESESIDNICNFLQEVFRLDGRLPSITQIYNIKNDMNSSNEARAAEIYWRVEKLLTLAPLCDVKKEIAMQLLVHISKCNFSAMMPTKTAKTFSEAVALVTEIKDRYYKIKRGNIQPTQFNAENGVQVNGNT